MPTPGLLRIPTELQHMIAHLTGKKDILALRLVCRDLSRAVDDPFLETFYSKRRHLITPYSLEYLVTISQDARLRSRLREVEFVIGELNRWACEDDHLDWSILLGPLTEEQIKADEEIALAKQALSTRWAIERKLIRSDITAGLMATALANLATSNIIPTISFGSNPIYPEVAFGSQQFATKLDTYPAVRSTRLEHIFERVFGLDDTASVYFGILLKALGESKFPMRRFVMDDSISVNTAGRYLSLSQCDDLKTSLKHLTALNLSPIEHYEAGHAIEYDENGLVDVPDMATLSQVLSMTRYLRKIDLFLGYEGHRYNEYVNLELGAYFGNNRLEEIALRGGLFGPEDLKEILEPHSDTLRALKLSSNALDTPGDWRHMFRWMAETMNIEHLTMWGCTAASTYFIQEGRDFMDPTIGRDLVRERLLHLAQNAVFEEEKDDYDDDY